MPVVFTAPKMRPSNRGSRVRKARRQASKSISMPARWALRAPKSRGFRTLMGLVSRALRGRRRPGEGHDQWIVVRPHPRTARDADRLPVAAGIGVIDPHERDRKGY